MTPADIAPPTPLEPVTRMSGTKRFVLFASSEMTLTNAVESALFRDTGLRLRLNGSAVLDELHRRHALQGIAEIVTHDGA